MKCFTDEQLTRGIVAIRTFDAFGMMTDADWRHIFLEAAEAPPPAIVDVLTGETKTRRCAVCQRPVIDAQGVVLVACGVADGGRWTCGDCTP